MNQLSLTIVLRRARMRGVSLLTAVFLLVVLAALSAAIVGVFGVQQANASLDILGVRADQAARSGLEWGLYHQLRVQPGVPSVACFSPSPVTFAMPSSPNSTLGGFSVTVSCEVPSANVAGNTTNRWTISAVACNKPGSGANGCLNAIPDADYVQRRVQAELN
jgi:MSHA biogenesis protein MshP